MAIFQVNLGYPVFTEAKDDESGGDNWRSWKSSQIITIHHQQINTQFFTGRMPFLSPNQQCQSTEGKKIHRLIEAFITTCNRF